MSQQTSVVDPFWRREIVRLFARGFLICLLVVPVTLNLPKVIHIAHAAPLEDCDADGFDDATGVAVPWPGYDETHGDTPAGPGTADWWIKQNQQAAPTGNSGSSGGNGGSPSASGGDSSGGSAPSSSTSKKSPSSGSSSTGSKSAVSANSPAPRKSAVVAAPVTAPVGTTAASVQTTAASVAATAPTSATSSASAESTVVVAAVSNSGKGGPTAQSNSLWSALTVGFTGDHTELFAGLGLLAALALAGALGVSVSAVRGLGRHARVRESDLLRTEEPVASTA